ncbi:putative bifunctional diguanylate cyclase/phosphodiesterase [Blastomonas fulva]|jgi:diguanylate cyclase (GGDEF)-like protein|uniref:putative bifunctional diguanylate cyclase/phosphodiesterase n=1 Tax=Blastomonas fulva TaxID=1550728 RepID=UPI003D2C6B3A
MMDSPTLPVRGRFRSLATRITVWYGVVIALTFGAFIIVATDGVERYAESVATKEMATNAATFDKILELQAKQMRTSADVLAADFGFREAFALDDQPTITSALESLRVRAGAPLAIMIPLQGDFISTGAPMNATEQDALWEAVDSGIDRGVFQVGGRYHNAVAAPILIPDLAGWLVLARPLHAAAMRELARLAPSGMSARIRASGPLPGGIDLSQASGKAPVETRLDGERILYWSKPLPALDTSLKPRVVLRYELSSALAEYNPIKFLLLALSAVGLTLSVLIGAFVSRGITRPIATLENAAREISRGSRDTVSIATDDEVGRLADSFNSMVESIKEREERITHIALHDELTGLPNRKLFAEQLEFALGRRASTHRIAIMYFDLDNFKAVNDTLGHPVGDELLRAVAERLRASMPGALISRQGGDEFAILIDQIEPHAKIALLADRVSAVFHSAFQLSDHRLETSSSIGIAVAPGDGDCPDELIKNADLALYRAKKEGRNCSCFFEQAMDLEARKRHQMEIDMREAVREGQFLLNYQPLFSLEKNRVMGFEALVRWQHPLRGLVSPAEFIPLAEDTGMIVPISEWVLNEACQRAGQWPDDIRIAVNLSPVLFKNAGLPLMVMQALDKAGLKPNRLELEVTESLFIDNIERTTAMLNALRDCGVRIALDDFGTGYSSLNYLRSFPFDKIKIDKSFVDDLATDISSQAIIGAITALASALGMETIAEGVEDQHQLEALRAQGCSNIQGYLFSRPVGIELVDAMIANMRYTQAEPNYAAETARARRVA